MSRRRARPEASPVEPELPITPMLDMSFQLMAFFVMTFRPSPTEAQLALALPKPDSGGATTATAPLDPLLMGEDDELIVQLFSSDNGNLLEIVAAAKTGNISLGTDVPTLAKYLREKAGSKPPKLRYEVADRLNLQIVIRMLDEAKLAGYDKVTPTLLTPPPGAKK